MTGPSTPQETVPDAGDAVSVMVTTTWLEIHAAPEDAVVDQRLRVEQAHPVNPALNRFLYTAVGSDWLWHGRRSWTWGQWEELLRADGYQTWIAHYEGSPAGYFELDATSAEDVEIVYFGLLPGFVGLGLGGEFIGHCLKAAWANPATTRVWLHTCSLDHPRALQNYLQAGFAIERVEEAEELLPGTDLEPWSAAQRPPRTTVRDHLR